jgi:DNA-binding MarR family transcriptional regulator
MSTKHRTPEEYENILKECLVYNTRRFTRLATNSLNQKLAPSGLRCTQYSILIAIGAQEGATMTGLSDYLGMDISTLTRSLDNLEQQGYISYESGNHREKHARLTDAGAAKIDEAYPLWEAEQKRFANLFDDGLIGRCRMFIERLIEDMKPSNR